MRTITTTSITNTVARLCREANCLPNDDLLAALLAALDAEESEDGRVILEELISNSRLAAESDSPVCQDTGTAVIFLEVGQDCQITGGDLRLAVDEGVRRGYRDGFLRASIVADPLRRKNTGDNTPALIHTEIVPGDLLKITVAAKGAGSENMSAIRMMTPAEGPEEITRFVVEWVTAAGANPCPPTVVGLGIGGNFEYSAILAKKAILLPIGYRNPDPFYAELEQDIVEELNRTGIGPGGLGGRITCLDCHILTLPCHIASLPVAINLDCCVARHKTAVL
jgi:fumarate hydratase subunit alpha